MSQYKQPPALTVLFLSELWERFGFYTVQGLLVLFLTKELYYDDVLAQDIVGAVIAFLYIMPIVGGWLADRILGFKLAVIIGGLFLTSAYFILAIPVAWSFKLGLSLMIIGSGFFKSSISSLVGTLYDEDDIRRISGYTFFYMGINIGALLSYIVSPMVAKYFSYHWAFMIAGLGMVIGTAIFWGSKGKLRGKGSVPSNSRLQGSWLGFPIKFWFSIALILTIIVITQLLNYSNLINKAVIIIGIACAIWLFFIGVKEGGQAAKNIIVLLVLLVISVLFWAFYFQVFSSVVLFIDRLVIRTLQFGDYSFTVEAAAFGGLTGIFVIVLSPIFAWLWMYLQKRGVSLSFPLKFSLSIIFVGLALLVLVLAISLQSHTGMIVAAWLLGFYLLLVIAELLLSPNGLAAVSMLVPKRMVGMSMGIFFATLAMGGALSSSIAHLVAIPEAIYGDTLAIAAVYSKVFSQLGIMLLVLGLILLGLSPFVQRLTVNKS